MRKLPDALSAVSQPLTIRRIHWNYVHNRVHSIPLRHNKNESGCEWVFSQLQSAPRFAQGGPAYVYRGRSLRAKETKTTVSVASA